MLSQKRIVCSKVDICIYIYNSFLSPLPRKPIQPLTLSSESVDKGIVNFHRVFDENITAGTIDGAEELLIFPELIISLVSPSIRLFVFAHATSCK